MTKRATKNGEKKWWRIYDTKNKKNAVATVQWIKSMDRVKEKIESPIFDPSVGFPLYEYRNV